MSPILPAGVAPLHPSNAPLFVAHSRRQVFNAGRSEADNDFVPTRGVRLLVAGLLLLCLPTTSGAQQPPPAAEKLARTYGVNWLGQIEAIRYTFNAQFPGVDLSRSWIWEPKTDQVTYEGKDKSGQPVKVTYKRSQLDGQPANVRDEIEPGLCQRSVLVASAVSCRLGRRRRGGKRRYAESAAR